MAALSARNRKMYRRLKKRLEQKARAFFTTVHHLLDYRESSNGTLLPLQNLDSDLTNQWCAVNGAKTITDGLSIASFVSFFVAPPVGIGFQIGAAVTAGSTRLADFILEKTMGAEFRKVMAQDSQRRSEMIQAARSYSEALQAETKQLDDLLAFAARASRANPSQKQQKAGDGWEDLEWIMQGARSIHTASRVVLSIKQLVQLGEVAKPLGGQGVVEITADGAAVAKGIAEGSAATGVVKVVASTGTKVWGGIGMAFSVADAVSSWATSKDIQEEIRETIRQVKHSMAELENFLAAANGLPRATF